MDWPTAVIAFLSGSTGALLIRHYLMTPKLAISYRDSERFGKMIEGWTEFRNDGTLVKPIRIPVAQYDRNWIRVSVENAGYGVAAKCRAYLTDVHFLPESGSPERIFWDCIPLKWSCLSDDHFDVPRGIHAMVDVLYAYTHGGRTQLRACIDHARQPRYQDLFGKFGAYRLMLVVSGENAAPQTFYLRVDWKGNWGAFGVSEDTQAP